MYLIGIAGGSGSGKTTFAQKSVKRCNSSKLALLHMDSYYRETMPEEFYVDGKPNFDHPSSFDWVLLKSHLETLKRGHSIDVPNYDFVTSSRLPSTQKIGPIDVCLIEGIYALWDQELRSMMDLKVYLDVESDIRFIRRLHRDVKERGRTLDSVVGQYYDTVRPMYRQFLEPTKQFADIIVGEETDIPANVIASKVNAILSE